MHYGLVVRNHFRQWLILVCRSTILCHHCHWNLDRFNQRCSTLSLLQHLSLCCHHEAINMPCSQLGLWTLSVGGFLFACSVQMTHKTMLYTSGDESCHCHFSTCHDTTLHAQAPRDVSTGLLISGKSLTFSGAEHGICKAPTSHQVSSHLPHIEEEACNCTGDTFFHFVVYADRCWCTDFVSCCVDGRFCTWPLL